MDKRRHGVLGVVVPDLLEVEEVAEDDKEEEAHVNVISFYLRMQFCTVSHFSHDVVPASQEWQQFHHWTTCNRKELAHCRMNYFSRVYY